MNILVTGGGCPGFYATLISIKEMFKSATIIATDVTQHTIAAHIANKYYTVPFGTDTDYIKSIIKIKDNNDIHLIIPLTDPELIPISMIQEAHDLQCLVMATTELNKVLDRSVLYQIAGQYAPNYQVCLGEQDIVRVFNKFNNNCYAKLITSYGSRGARRVIGRAQDIDRFNCKPEYAGKVITLNELITSTRNSEPILLCELLPGPEYSVDCIFDRDGELVSMGIREREIIRNGICTTSKFITDAKDFLRVIESLSSQIHFRYNINFQLKRDANGKLKLLEINPRISGSLDSFRSQGYDFVKAGLNILLENRKPVWPRVLTHYKTNRAYRVSFFMA